MNTSNFSDAERKAAWKNVVVLMLAGSILMSAAPLVVGSAGLAAQTLLGNNQFLATVPVTTFNFGIALGAIPAAFITQKFGRKYGFILGAVYCAFVALLMGASIVLGSFLAFALTAFLLGTAYSFAIQFRFAVADVGDPAFKAKAMSVVMLGGIGAAIIGPQIIIHAHDLLAPYSFAGAYMSMAAVALLGALVLLLYKVPKSSQDISQNPLTTDARPLGEIIKQPQFIVSTACTISAGALMAFVMTAAPLAMVACGFSTSAAALGIQWHVMAMFAFSPLTGSLIAKYGAEKIVSAGLVLLIGCAIVALTGIELWQFYTSLILLGLGWNFAFIGGSNLVTRTYFPAERNKVQGFFDFLVYGFSALASGLSGMVFILFGWNIVNIIIFPVVAMAIAALIWLSKQKSVLMPTN